MPSKRPWAGSNRRAELPPDWEDRRKATARRARGICECTGCRRHDGRCTKRGSDADHRTDPNDHDDLQWLCRPCHNAKTQKEAAAGRAWRYARFDNSEPHPGAPPA